MVPVSVIAKGESGAVAFELAPLIQSMAAGHEEALAAFYDRTRRQVYGLVERILRDAPLAEEVTLDIYMQVWRDAAGYREERGSPVAWLVTLARSRAIDRLRTLKTVRQQCQDKVPYEEDMMVAGDPLPDDWVVDAERARHVHKALAQLLPEQRQVLALSYFEGLSHSEIAERLATPLGTVKTRIRTAMQHLQELLSPWCGEDAS